MQYRDGVRVLVVLVQQVAVLLDQTLVFGFELFESLLELRALVLVIVFTTIAFVGVWHQSVSQSFG